MYKTLVVFLLSFTAIINATLQSSTPRKVLASQVTQGSVSLTVTVTNDKGELVSGLKQEHFSVFVDKVPAKIHYFGDQDVPVSIGILFDLSASIKDSNNSKKLKVLGEALSKFLSLANNSNDYFVGGFNNKPQLLLDWTSDPKAILDLPFSIFQPKGGTALYDAIAVSVGKVLQGRHRKRAIFLISDGLDSVSRYTFKQIQKLLKESNLLVYSIYVGNAAPGSALDFEGRAVLDELSAASGGVVLNPKSRTSAVSAVFERIAQELRHQYTIGIAPTSSEGTTKWHGIKVKVTPPHDAPRKMKLSTRTREGYYGTNLN